MATTENQQQTVRMTRGKFAGINALADAQGVIAAAAMDQRGSLRNALIQAGIPNPTPDQMTEFKAIVTEGLTPYASAILLDPEYSLPVIPKRAPDTGVLLAYEKWGYETSTPGRLPDRARVASRGLTRSVQYRSGGASKRRISTRRTTRRPKRRRVTPRMPCSTDAWWSI